LGIAYFYVVVLMTAYHVPTLSEQLDKFRLIPLEDLFCLIRDVIPSEKLPIPYLATLDDEDTTTAYRACLLAWAVTGGTQVPRELQLRAFLATSKGQDSLIEAGTGSGKTLPIALNLLLDDPADNLISLTISPLKRLQITQASIK
jgi:ATP-dependent helicase YprA (DUF1998 family)